MLGWLRAATARTSFWNRRIFSSSTSPASGSTFKCNPPVHGNLFGLVNDAHSTPTNLTENPKVTELFVLFVRDFAVGRNVGRLLGGLQPWDHRSQQVADLGILLDELFELWVFAASSNAGSTLRPLGPRDRRCHLHCSGMYHDLYSFCSIHADAIFSE